MRNVAAAAPRSRSTAVAIGAVVLLVAGAIALLRVSRDGKSEDGPPSGVNPPSARGGASSAAKAGEVAEILQILLVYVEDVGRPVHRADGQWISRTKGEARALADSILESVRKGERFESLVLKHTDDLDESGQPRNGATVSIAKGVTPMNKDLEAEIFRTRVGAVVDTPFDAGLAYVIFRRDR